MITEYSGRRNALRLLLVSGSCIVYVHIGVFIGVCYQARVFTSPLPSFDKLRTGSSLAHKPSRQGGISIVGEFLVPTNRKSRKRRCGLINH